MTEEAKYLKRIGDALWVIFYALCATCGALLGKH